MNTIAHVKVAKVSQNQLGNTNVVFYIFSSLLTPIPAHPSNTGDLQNRGALCPPIQRVDRIHWSQITVGYGEWG